MNKVMATSKKILTIYVLIFTCANLFAQSDSAYTWSYKLEGEAWKNWDSINQVWMKKVYFPCLKENNLKMSCANCENIYIDAGFIVDQDGKLADIIIFKENICSNKASTKLKKCFFNYYKNLVFPQALRNKKIKAKFGTGLKC